MDFRTRTELQSGSLKIGQEHQLMLLGSCFAEEIGTRLINDKFDCDLNPYGVLYNPLSIAGAVAQLLEGYSYTEKDLFFHGGLWHSWMHHGSYSSANQVELLKRINDRSRQAGLRLKSADLLMITLGSNCCYYHKKGKFVVGNCHKVPAREFEKKELDPQKIFSVLTEMLDALFAVNPKIQVVFTVSPVRYLSYGLHGSNLGKAALLLGIEKVCRNRPQRVSYFPAYEILMDELRDYRFYAEDMAHPSSVAAEYIYSCFKQCFFTEQAMEVAAQCREISKAIAHKPFHPESEEYHRFMTQTLGKIEHLQQEYPFVSLNKERELCTLVLKKFQ